MIAVTVAFRADPSRADAFREAVLLQARNSLAAEERCRRFDVCLHPEDPARIFLYELYDDDEAFEAHLRTPHFLDFDAKVRGWLLEKQVSRWRVREEGGP
jgi:autoinducer 2-degrading protein